eukprot:248625-Prorocentrum_minimum.AAC.1
MVGGREGALDARICLEEASMGPQGEPINRSEHFLVASAATRHLTILLAICSLRHLEQKLPEQVQRFVPATFETSSRRLTLVPHRTGLDDYNQQGGLFPLQTNRHVREWLAGS